ncbi:MAG: GNAT family N-acetyltransferase [Gemmataceae bacterium]
MIEYRSFRNPDPPLLADVWNASLAGPRTVLIQPRSTGLLEYFTMAKPYFDPAGLTFALDEGRPVGFVHAGFGPGPADSFRPDTATGVVCALGVAPTHRRRGVGGELLRRAEDYLRGKGAREILAGPARPANPFTFGLYGGSDSVGFLASDGGQARSFFERKGYAVCRSVGVFQRALQRPHMPADARFLGLQPRFEIVGLPYSKAGWYRECVLGPIEAVEYRLKEKSSGEVAARVVLWDMATFGFAWGETAVGLLDLDVAPQRRRQGMAKFLLAHVLAHLHQQTFDRFEACIDLDNAAAAGLLRTLLFEQVDTGHGFRKS